MKILLCSEFTYLPTGFARYYKQLASALTKEGHEVIELASYGQNGNWQHEKYKQKTPWKIYLVEPNPKDSESIEKYNKHSNAVNGGWMYEEVLIKEMPDVVIGLRDYTYDNFIIDSPLSKYTTVILSTTVDSYPQPEVWISGLSKADHLTFYNSWSEKQYLMQCKGDNVCGHISPAADDNFKKLDKTKCRESLGLPTDIKIVGTVMRNNPRKRFPELFEAISQTEDIYLYCHTTYPDGGWNIPAMIYQYNLQNKVFFTYQCQQCGAIESRLWSSCSNHCNKCKGHLIIPTPKKGISDNELNCIYNSFDLCLQWSNSEGFGIPPIEAAKAEVPTIACNYSAQTDVIDNISGILIDPMQYSRNEKSNTIYAIPDNKKLVDVLNNYNWEEKKIPVDFYNWENTIKKWIELIDNLDISLDKWQNLPTYHQPIAYSKIENLPNDQFIIACIKHVLQDIDFLGTYEAAKFLDTLNNKFIEEGSGAKYRINVTKKNIYNRFYELFKEKDFWEGYFK